MSRKRLYSPRPLPTGTYCAFILLQMAEPSKSSHELANEKISAAFFTRLYDDNGTNLNFIRIYFF